MWGWREVGYCLRNFCIVFFRGCVYQGSTVTVVKLYGHYIQLCISTEIHPLSCLHIEIKNSERITRELILIELSKYIMDLCMLYTFLHFGSDFVTQSILSFFLMIFDILQTCDADYGLCTIKRTILTCQAPLGAWQDWLAFYNFQ